MCKSVISFTWCTRTRTWNFLGGFPRREADFGNKKKAATGSNAHGESEGTALDGVDGTSIVSKKKSKLEEAAKGSASLGSFLRKMLQGSCLSQPHCPRGM